MLYNIGDKTVAREMHAALLEPSVRFADNIISGFFLFQVSQI
jgi:hypothetical protein